jgi:hypothetical protein
MIIQTWGAALNQSFNNFAPAAVTSALNLIAALIIFAVGWIVGSFIGDLIEKLFKVAKVDSGLRQAGLEEVLKKGDIRLNSGAFVGGLVKWFIIAIFFLSALEVFQLTQVNAYLTDVVVGYLPHVIVAVLILLASIIIAEAVQKIVTGAAATAHVRSSRMLGVVTKWAIIIFAVLAALVELNIAASLIQILFIGIVAALSIAFGLAFGLGGRDAAARVLDRSMNNMNR